jgi:hypothetical protein
MDAAAQGHCDRVGRGRAWEFTEGLVWLIVTLVVLAFAVVVLGGVVDGGRGGGGDAPRDPRVGDCANDTTSAQAGGTDAIDCAEPHRYEVYAVLTHSEARGAAYPGDQAVQKDERKRCGDAFTDFVDVGPDDSPTLKFVWAGPNQETWNDGERNFQCVLLARSEEMLTGSMKGTRN